MTIEALLTEIRDLLAAQSGAPGVNNTPAAQPTQPGMVQQPTPGMPGAPGMTPPPGAGMPGAPGMAQQPTPGMPGAPGVTIPSNAQEMMGYLTNAFNDLGPRGNEVQGILAKYNITNIGDVPMNLYQSLVNDVEALKGGA